MENNNTLTDDQIKAILKGMTCPACGSRKRPMRPFDPICYNKLTPAQQNALYRERGNGYEEAFVAAVDALAGQMEAV